MTEVPLHQVWLRVCLPGGGVGDRMLQGRAGVAVFLQQHLQELPLQRLKPRHNVRQVTPHTQRPLLLTKQAHKGGLRYADRRIEAVVPVLYLLL
jgi:hypothetical protein